jgi:hypothetical protein
MNLSVPSTSPQHLAAGFSIGQWWGVDLWGMKRGEGGWEGECEWSAFVAVAVADVAVVAVVAVDTRIVVAAAAAAAAAAASVIVAVAHIVAVVPIALVHIVPVLVVVFHVVLFPLAVVVVWLMAQGSHTQALVLSIGGRKR